MNDTMFGSLNGLMLWASDGGFEGWLWMSSPFYRIFLWLLFDVISLLSDFSFTPPWALDALIMDCISLFNFLTGCSVFMWIVLVMVLQKTVFMVVGLSPMLVHTTITEFGNWVKCANSTLGVWGTGSLCWRLFFSLLMITSMDNDSHILNNKAQRKS